MRRIITDHINAIAINLKLLKQALSYNQGHHSKLRTITSHSLFYQLRIIKFLETILN